jgi:undecaprenyl-diphosphatase
VAGRRPPANRRAALLVAVIVLGAGLLATTVGISAPGLGTALVLAAVALGAAARFGFAELRAVMAPARGRPAGAPEEQAPGGAAPAGRPRGGAGAPAAAALLTAVASLAVVVPLARLVGDGSERLAFTLGGFAALLAAVPVHRLGGAAAPWLVRAVARRAVAYAAATGALLLLAIAIHNSALLDLDTAALEELHELDATSGLVDSLFVAPSLRNYVIILAVVALAGARLWGRTTPGRTLLISAGAACVAYAGVRGCWALWERPRPEEVLAAAPVTGRSWAPYPSFPSGHMAVTSALALVTAALVPKLRFVLWGYAAIIAFTRMSYGAHFPSDVLLGAVLGWLAYRVTVTPLRRPGDPGRPGPAAAAADP